jgi:hypothetical protein
MKKNILLFALLFIPGLQSFAQSDRYLEGVKKIEKLGYTIADEMNVNISESMTGYSYRHFYGSLNYVVFAISEDKDVTDLDVYVYDEDGEVIEKDADESDMAVISFNTGRDMEGKIVIKNYKSNDPDYKSLCRYVVAYKGSED